MSQQTLFRSNITNITGAYTGPKATIDHRLKSQPFIILCKISWLAPPPPVYLIFEVLLFRWLRAPAVFTVAAPGSGIFFL